MKGLALAIVGGVGIAYYLLKDKLPTYSGEETHIEDTETQNAQTQETQEQTQETQESQQLKDLPGVLAGFAGLASTKAPKKPTVFADRVNKQILAEEFNKRLDDAFKDDIRKKQLAQEEQKVKSQLEKEKRKTDLAEKRKAPEVMKSSNIKKVSDSKITLTKAKEGRKAHLESRLQRIESEKKQYEEKRNKAASASTGSSVAAVVSRVIDMIVSRSFEMANDEYSSECPAGYGNIGNVSDDVKRLIEGSPVVGELMTFLFTRACYRNSCPEGKVLENGLCYNPCPQGFKSDGATMCYKQYPEWESNGMLHTLTSITKKIEAEPGKPLSRCPAGKRQEGALCYDDLGPDWRLVGGTAWKNCPDGFRDDGALCNGGLHDVGHGLLPEYGSCPDGFRTEPVTCFKDLKCG